VSRRVAVLARVCVVAGVLCLSVGFVSGSAQGELGTVSLSAESSGESMIYDQPGSPIPAQPTGEMHKAYSLATLTSGPASHGIASHLWPGSTAADGGTAFGFPKYPVRAEALYPSTPHDDKQEWGQEGQGARMEAHASGKSAEGIAVSGSGSGKPLIETGNATSSAKTTVEKALATSEGTATVSDITILDVVHIDSVLTSAKVTSDGKKAVLAGSTEVSGATVQGQGVTIDGKGVHLGGQTVPILDPISNQQVEDGLAQAGITMKVANPIDKTKGSTSSRTLGGLIVQFEAGALNKVIDQFPQELQDQIKKYIELNEVITYRFGSVAVSAETSSGSGFQIPKVKTPTGAPGGSIPGGSIGGAGGSVGGYTGGGGITFGSSGGGGGGIAPPTGGVTQQPGPAQVGFVSVPRVPSHPVPFVLVGLALLAAVGSSRVMRHVADKALTAQAGPTCPLEDR
jgi:hypothetical protein